MHRSANDSERLRLVSRAAGLCFLLLPLLLIPALLVSGEPDVRALLPVGLTTSAIGIVVLLLPWHQLPYLSLHALPIVACALATWSVLLALPDGTVVLWSFLLVGPLVALATSDPREIVPQMLLLAGCLLPAVFLGDSSPETQGTAIIAVPVIWGLTAIVAVQNARETRQEVLLKEQVRSDPLTGVGNRRLLDERLDYEIKRHRRSGRTLVLITLDLNRFKEINDEFGHPAGDTVLRAAAAALCDAVRESDTVARQGGDEFCVLAPEIEGDGVVPLAASIERALGQVDAAGHPLTAAIGWALYPDDAADGAALIAAADADQLLAKRGEPRYETATGGPVSEPTRIR
ncbi:MAG: GGDEF domain-containing protein [Solirubrobacteraceae bacterium]|nr:GGDEF domain-containing protein [Solirubrobacteraceae bacterium]